MAEAGALLTIMMFATILFLVAICDILCAEVQKDVLQIR